MDDAYLGTIHLFAFNWIPEGYLPCNGQLLNIQQYTALYSLLSNRYGGDGRTTFGLPKMDAPNPNMVYGICVEGYYPTRP